MAAVGTEVGQAGPVECWCCGRWQPADGAVHLGSHPEVWVCLRCAHDVHHRAVAREDAQRRSAAARLRDVARSARHEVMRRGWQHSPLLGPVLRRLGNRWP